MSAALRVVADPPRTEEPETRMPGEEGLWVFILGDMGMFALFFGTIMVTLVPHPRTYAESQHHLHPWLGILNTVLLLTGSLLVVRGMRRLGDGSPVAARLFTGAFLCAIGFGAVKVTEYTMLVHDGYTGGTNDFFMYYFVFTGIHLAHLVIGAVVMLFLVRTARLPRLTRRRWLAAECGGIYWHMVDLLWLVLFPLLYLVR